MRPEDVAAAPPRPDSEFEWEDLLVRLELMLRALPVTLEEVEDASRVAGILDQLATSEAAVADFLERAAGIAPAGVGSSGPSVASASAPTAGGPPLNVSVQAVISQEDNVDRFLRLRRRNFAVVQRRGIEVWDWSANFGAAGKATVHQILSAAVQADVRALAAIRGAVGEGGDRC